MRCEHANAFIGDSIEFFTNFLQDKNVNIVYSVSALSSKKKQTTTTTKQPNITLTSNGMKKEDNCKYVGIKVADNATAFEFFFIIVI